MVGRRSKRGDWVASALLLIGGSGFLLFVFLTTPRAVGESELLIVSGIAADAELRMQAQLHSTKQTLGFSLGGYRFQYNSLEKGFGDLVDGIRAEENLTILVHPDPAPAVLKNVPTEIYGLKAGNKSILTYSDSISDQRVGLAILYGIGGAMLLSGILGGVWCFVRRGERIDDSMKGSEDVESS